MSVTEHKTHLLIVSLEGFLVKPDGSKYLMDLFPYKSCSVA